MSESYRDDNSTEVTGAGEPEGYAIASEMLRTARERLGLSQKEVADELFLTSRFIRYIDEADYDRLPKPTFVKGYLRSYARVVHISGDEVVGHYQRSLDEAQDSLEFKDVAEESLGSSNFTGPVLRTGIAGLIGLLLIVALVWWLVADNAERPSVPVAEPPAMYEGTESFDETPESIAAAMAESEVATIDSEPAIVDSEPATTDQVIRDAVSVDTGVESQQTMDPIEQNAPAREAVLPTIQEPEPSPIRTRSVGPLQKEVYINRAFDGETNYITVNAGGDDRIEITFNDECWVEITDAESAPIYGDLNREGDLLRVQGEAPFEILLGRATSVTIQFNGRRVDVDRYIASDQTARVKLGG